MTLEPNDTSSLLVLVKDSRAPLLPFWRGESASFLFFLCMSPGKPTEKWENPIAIEWKTIQTF